MRSCSTVTSLEINLHVCFKRAYMRATLTVSLRQRACQVLTCSCLQAVTRCLCAAGPQHHILNVGHGVVQGTPEESVKLFCDLARRSAAIHQPQLAMA